MGRDASGGQGRAPQGTVGAVPGTAGTVAAGTAMPAGPAASRGAAVATIRARVATIESRRRLPARVRAWARSPVVVVQAITLLLSFSFWGGETKPGAVVLAVVSVVVLVCVLHPASTRALAAAEEID